MGEVFEALGEQLGNYFWEEILWFMIPLALLACLHWLAKKVLTPLPEPDYRTILIAVLGALVVARCVILALIKMPDEQFQMMILDIAFLSGMLVWMFVKLGRWLTMLLIGYAVVQLIASIWLLFHPEIDSVGRAAVLGFMILYLGMLLWSIVAFRYWNKLQLEAV